MRKISAILLSLLLFSISDTAFSQFRYPVKLGLRVSPNIGWMSPGTKDYAKNGQSLGATVGFVGDIYFAGNYAVSTGFDFQFLNGKLKYPDSRDTLSGQINRKYKFIYLEIPILFKMNTKSFGKVSFYGQMGFGTAFRLKANYDEKFYSSTGIEIDTQDNLSDSTSLIRESVLVGIGCNYHIDESTSIFVGLDYSNSLNNVLSGINHKSRLNEKSMLNYVALTVGVLF